MQKKQYKKPEIKEVKLSINDTLLGSCRISRTAPSGGKRATACRSCRTTYTSS